MNYRHKQRETRTSEDSNLVSEEVQNKHIYNETNSGDSKPKKESLYNDFKDSLFNSFLTEVLFIIPLGISGWLIIMWGMLWLLVPFVVVAILVLKKFYQYLKWLPY